MAFTVTPTSGAGPYTYTSEITNKEQFAAGFFRLEFASLTSTTSCPTDFAGGAVNQVASDALLNTDEYTRPTAIPAGSCNTAVLRVVRIADNVIIDYVLASINNI